MSSESLSSESDLQVSKKVLGKITKIRKFNNVKDETKFKDNVYPIN